MHSTEKALKRLAQLTPNGYSVGTTAPRAPWNPTGKRIWQLTDRRGRSVATVFSTRDLERAIQKVRAVSLSVTGATT